MLKLRKNNIKFLMDGAFFGLNSMEQLYLDRNQVLSIDQNTLIPFQYRCIKGIFLEEDLMKM